MEGLEDPGDIIKVGLGCIFLRVADHFHDIGDAVVVIIIQ